jgi:phosphotriesterase-related protein
VTSGPPPIRTVLGPRTLPAGGIVDAHAHLWISRVPGGAADAPVLDDEAAIRAELGAFARAGGSAVIDCQPGGCGRDVSVLARLARDTGVAVVAATGFHLRRYYPDGASPWDRSADELTDHFLTELRVGANGGRGPGGIRAGIVKAAHPGTLGADVRRMFTAAAAAAAAAGVVLVIHTERGAGVEALAEFLLGLDLSSEDVMLCHVDKRPDLALHRELAQAGFLLEYDTFLRPKYEPERNVWPLVDAMLAEGHGASVACALDLADRALWRFGGDPVGMDGLPTVVAGGLRARGASDEQVAQLTGGNVVARLQDATRRRVAA